MRLWVVIDTEGYHEPCATAWADEAAAQVHADRLADGYGHDSGVTVQMVEVQVAAVDYHCVGCSRPMAVRLPLCGPCQAREARSVKQATGGRRHLGVVQ